MFVIIAVKYLEYIHFQLKDEWIFPFAVGASFIQLIYVVGAEIFRIPKIKYLLDRIEQKNKK